MAVSRFLSEPLQIAVESIHEPIKINARPPEFKCLGRYFKLKMTWFRICQVPING